MQFCDAVVGNSSSGIAEVPSYKIPTVNIGNRQKGRIYAESVINCPNDPGRIEEALMKALSSEFRNRIANVTNPYEGERTSERIVETIRREVCQGMDVKKDFYDLKVD